MATSFEEYIKNVDLKQLFKKLGAANPETIAKGVQHFTAKEGDKRDAIVLGYFGEKGVNRIVEAITERLLSAPSLRTGSKVLDVGAGSGFFTAKIAERTKSKIPHVAFYAMDATPAMLLALAKKKTSITPFLGVAENIEASIKEARAYAEIPDKFDAVFSTLMLHHSTKPEKVFENIKKALSKNGKAIILDLCEHKFTEFKTEMGDVHLGFKLDAIRKMAKPYFSEVEIEKMPGIGCSCSDRSAEIFIVSMRNTTSKTVI
ncbi:MAG TPA: class I SAM-dependent methyltransferase [Candidatus Bathyarchaeia archaeon]|nr:class I SAM-dependent methyltransferase [Candidatus Bathyarchaeia archaeon]